MSRKGSNVKVYEVSGDKFELYVSGERTELIVKYRSKNIIRPQKEYIVLKNRDEAGQCIKFKIKHMCKIEKGEETQDDIDGKTITPSYYKITFDMTPQHRPKAPYTE